MPTILAILSSVVLLSSCAHAPVAKKIKEPQPMPASLQGTVIDLKALSQGGSVGLTALKAGPLAEANDDLDRISAMVIKGIKETLEAQKSQLSLVSDDSQPDMVFEGYVEEFSKKGGFMMQASITHLVIVGDVWLGTTGKRVLEFSVDKKFDPKKQALADIAYGIGQEIGRFMLFNAAAKDKI